MDGENHGKPYLLMDDLGGKPHYFRKHPNKVVTVTASGWGSFHYLPSRSDSQVSLTQSRIDPTCLANQFGDGVAYGRNPRDGGVSPQKHPRKNRGFHDFHHPLWGKNHLFFGNTPYICKLREFT